VLTKPALSAGELRHFRFIRARLCLDQIRVVIVALDQLGGRTAFDNLSFVQDKDQVRVANILETGWSSRSCRHFFIEVYQEERYESDRGRFAQDVAGRKLDRQNVVRRFS